MDNTTRWEAEAKELLERVMREIEQVHADFDKKLAQLEQRKWAIEESIRAYRELMGINVTQAALELSPDNVKGKSHKDILKLIASRNDGLLVVKYAIRMMKDANVFGNPDNADSAVYSVLQRTPEFRKVGKGVYKLNGGVEIERARQLRLKVRRKAPKSRSGVVQAIRSLKEEHPEMTKMDVLNTLTRRQFDFKGKIPVRAVNMAWARLGYRDGKPTHSQSSIKEVT